MKNINYEKVKKINDAIKRILTRIDQIDAEMKNIVPPLLLDKDFRAIQENTIKGLMEERKQLFEIYQKDLKELEKCH